MDADQLREQIWPFRTLWGDKRKGVRDYLKMIWKENVYTVTVETNYENAKREAELILQWWWQNRYDQTGSHSLYQYPEVFGTFLLGKYSSAYSLNPGNNQGLGRFA